jgi:hypothetical protein
MEAIPGTEQFMHFLVAWSYSWFASLQFLHILISGVKPAHFLQVKPREGIHTLSDNAQSYIWG